MSELVNQYLEYFDLPECRMAIGGLALQHAGVNSPQSEYNYDPDLSRYHLNDELQALQSYMSDILPGGKLHDPDDSTWRIDEGFRLSSRELPEDLADAKEGLVKWLASADHNLVLRFLQWNELTLRPLQIQLREKVKSLQPVISQNMRDLHSEEHLPRAAINVIEPTFKQTEVFITDSFVDGLPNAVAFYSRSKKAMAVAEQYINDEDTFNTIQHEYIHGFMHHANSSLDNLTDESTTWLNEAYVEHLSQAATHGEFHIMNPDERSQENGTYYERRKLAAKILGAGAINISTDQLSKVAFERRTKIAFFSYTERDRFREQIHASWADTFPEHISRRYRTRSGLFLTVSKEISECKNDKEEAELIEDWIAKIDKRVASS